ncbi:unnamed protein product [Peniophora sp. CBMAI 1063]|nr:unnamed protein product [Peniophora sp. CBMAI 1063]
MRRFGIGDNARQRKRHAGGFLFDIQAPKLSSSTFLTPPIGHLSTFTFVSDKLPVQNDGPPALAHSGPGGKSVMLNSVIIKLGAEKLADAFKTPFRGICLKDAEAQNEENVAAEPIHESLPESDTGLTSTAPQPDKPSISRRLRKLFNEFPILPWKMRWRELFLRESIRLDGRAEALGLTSCPGCHKEGFPDYRCEDCRGADLCKDCTLHWHRYSPLHRIERYNETKGFYEKVNGSELGIRIQLMHRPGEVCNFRSLHSISDFTVIHTNGIHQIPVDFCKCELGRDIPYHIQLMRWRFWPATCENPQTATTFEALDLFTRLSVLGRLNVYDFYRALEAATDAAKLKGVACVRQQLSNCVRQFRHIMMFKRAGRGHEPGGIAGTPSGACAVRCPACPNFELNEDKDDTEGLYSWLKRVILALDANFRLSNKLRCSSKETDPHLTDGKAYMAPWKDYEAHTAATVKELAQPSTCNKFAAVEMANARGGKGQRSTGVAACLCARHEIVQPLGVAPLRKGERYESIDWILCGALSHIHALEVTISYDVVCQYCKKLAARLALIPCTRVIWAGAQTFASLLGEGRISYVVPKFHLYAHKVHCQLRFALNWLFGTAVTDGEAPERLWSNTNAAVSSLREMGPGGNNDVLDDMFGAWNWQKTCRMNSSLLLRMDRALDEGEMITGVYTDLTRALRAMQPEKLTKTDNAVKAWDSGDKTKMKDSQCPYYAKKQGETRIDLRLYHEDPTDKQATARTKALNVLVQSIIGFRAEQEACMPSTHATLTDEERYPDRESAMTVQLCLPSDPPDGDELHVPAAARVVESRLRWAAMVDELDRLLHQLRLKGCLHKFKVAHITGQNMSISAQATQAAVNTHIKKAADAYRRHRAAYLKLEGKGPWEDTMRELQDSDCRSLGDRLIEQIEKMSHKRVTAFLQGKRKADSSGETNYKLPWIWFNWTETSDDAVSDELMAEWAKSRASAIHWVQEVRLVDAEMQRVLNFNESMARIWDLRRDCHETIDVGEDQGWACDDGWVDGMHAYASKQAYIRRAQADKWRMEFAPLRAEARRFLAVHTDDGLSVDPSTILPAREVEEMKHQIHTRRDRRKKAKRPRPAKDDATHKSAPRDDEDDSDEPALGAHDGQASNKRKRCNTAKPKSSRKRQRKQLSE